MGRAMTRLMVLMMMSWPLTACGGGASLRPAMQQSTPAPSGAAGRLLAKTARVDLEVDDEDDFEPTLKELSALATELKGYVVQQGAERIVFKVPSAQLDAALARVGRLGEITDQAVESVDVTAQHTDLEVRIENLRRLRGRLRELVTQASDVETILKVETELARVTGELERLEAQMRLLANQIAMSQVAVNLEQEVSPGPVGWIGYGVYRGAKWLFIWD